MNKIVILFGMLSLGLVLAGKPVAAMMCHGGDQHEEHSKNEKSQTKAQAQDVSYTTVYSCPMHPQVQSDKPGKCPKCGMNLKKVKVPTAYLNKNKKETKVDKKADEKSILYACPMHPEVQSSKEGKCPKCGMNLEKK